MVDLLVNINFLVVIDDRTAQAEAENGSTEHPRVAGRLWKFRCPRQPHVMGVTLLPNHYVYSSTNVAVTGILLVYIRLSLSL